MCRSRLWTLPAYLQILFTDIADTRSGRGWSGYTVFVHFEGSFSDFRVLGGIISTWDRMCCVWWLGIGWDLLGGIYTGSTGSEGVVDVSAWRLKVGNASKMRFKGSFGDFLPRGGIVVHLG